MPTFLEGSNHLLDEQKLFLSGVSHQIWPNWRWKAVKQPLPCTSRLVQESSLKCACNCRRKAQLCLVSEPTEVLHTSSSAPHHPHQNRPWCPARLLFSDIGIEGSTFNISEEARLTRLSSNSAKEVVESPTHAQHWFLGWILLTGQNV